MRAVSLATGLEEENVDCVRLTLILDSGGNDISEPAGILRWRSGRLPWRGARVRVEWAYPRTTGPKAPTGFHVYLGLDAGPLCSLSSVRSGRVTRAYSGSVWLDERHLFPRPSSTSGARALNPGMAPWVGSANYSSAVATVL